MLGQAKLALCFQIPSQASLHGILKAQRSLCCANGPALSLRAEIVGRKCGVALGFQAGMCCEKHLQARLRVSFQQQIQHSHSESTRDFWSFYLTRSLPLISPCGPTFGCSTAHLPRRLVVYILVIRGLKFLAAKRRENAKNDGLTVGKTFYTFHTCLQQQL